MASGRMRSGSRGLCLTVALAGIIACEAGPTAPSAPLNEPIVLEVGRSVRVADARVTLRFDGVTGDSRCPADAFCVLGGDAIVVVTVTPSVGATARYELHTAGPSTVRHNGFTVRLEELSPYPFSARPIDPSTYQATLRVTP